MLEGKDWGQLGMEGTRWPKQARAPSGTLRQSHFFNKIIPSRHDRGEEKGGYPEKLDWGRSGEATKGVMAAAGAGAGSCHVDIQIGFDVYSIPYFSAISSAKLFPP